jgi:hypothetical protein
LIGTIIDSIRKNGPVRCIAMHGHNDQCPKEAEFVFFYQIQGKLNTAQFCDDDAYEHSMYLSNYLGLKVTVKRINRPMKVSFT